MRGINPAIKSSNHPASAIFGCLEYFITRFGNFCIFLKWDTVFFISCFFVLVGVPECPRLLFCKGETKMKKYLAIAVAYIVIAVIIVSYWAIKIRT